MRILLIKLFISFQLLFIKIPLLAQWNTSMGENPFDGLYKSATLTGKGYSFPYIKPKLVFNLFNEKSSNFYFSDIGYTGCDNNKIILKFNKDEQKYFSNPTTDKNKEILFFDSFYFENNIKENVELDEFSIIELMNNNDKLSIRFSNDCGTNDYDFMLKGSKVALNYVYNNFEIFKNNRLKTLKLIENEILNNKYELERIKKEKDD